LCLFNTTCYHPSVPHKNKQFKKGEFIPMYKIKDTARRVSALAGAMALMLGTTASMLPAIASADALNPLTERSLTLTSSSPGFHYLDAAGNATYAPAGSGNNGKQTGEVLTFKVSTNTTAAPVKAFTMQWCTSPAGQCLAPGDNYVKHGSHTDTADSTDFDVNFPSAAQGTVTHNASQHLSTNNFQIFIGGTQESGGVASTPGSTPWVMSTSNVEDYTGAMTTAAKTGKHNYVTFTNATGVGLTPGQEVSIVLYGTDTNYIQNPGSGAFFVRANTYNSASFQNFRDAYPNTGNICDSNHTTYNASGTATCNQNVIDGGVTVANVMNDSIQIQTKVPATPSIITTQLT
jgi:hypothetical protein